MNELNRAPYQPLGKYLKNLRTRANESLAEASGAVEIDVRELAGYELGKKRPNEDVLLLLISHFGAKDEEAVKLWEMAGYGVEKIPASRMASAESASIQTGPAGQIIFTDIVDIMVNNYGVVMNFMQGVSGSSTQSVARVGMSREHAKSVLKILQHTLSQTEQSHPGRTTSSNSSQNPKN